MSPSEKIRASSGMRDNVFMSKQSQQSLTGFFIVNKPVFQTVFNAVPLDKRIK
jgi:hypothetical protein